MNCDDDIFRNFAIPIMATRNMKTIFRLTAMMVLCWVMQPMHAQDTRQFHDTLCIYQSWEAIFDHIPDQVLLDPYIEEISPYDVYFEVGEPTTDRMLYEESVAVALGDTLWFVNSNWLQENFGGDSRKMDDWVPLYYNAKIAFVQWEGLNFFGISDEYADIYLIDFEHAKVSKVDHKLLTTLLDPYPDLQRRYVSMKDFKKNYIIQHYFFEYIERLNADPTVPWIIDY